MLFGILSAIALTIGITGTVQDVSTNGWATPEEEIVVVQDYGPIYPAYCEDE